LTVVPEEVEIPLPIRLDGEEVETETNATSVGAFVLVLDTTIPERGIQLQSIYLGHKGVQTLASHLLLAGHIRETIAAEHDPDMLPVWHARRACLYDHLQRLQDLLDQLGLQAQISLGNDALRAMED
jgi:hypothetical protein